ncbi:Uncharacterised protein r2_g2834 [Pycnogonum litorale]
MQSKHRESLRDLIAKLRKKPQRVKTLNQTISRKEATIRVLRQALKERDLAKQLAEAKEEITRWKRTHEKIKKRKKERHASQTTDEAITSLTNELKEKEDIIRNLENEKLVLEETVEQLKTLMEQEKKSKKDEKTYSLDTRMMLYDAVVNQVPTKNVPTLIQKFSERSGITLKDVPHQNTIEQMTRELGVISDLQAAEIAMKTTNLTLRFDATTQEGVHINSVHYTTSTDCQVVAIDQLPGGTAEYYGEHVCESVDVLAKSYSDFHHVPYQNCRSTIIGNISNSLTDRAAVNHAAIQKISETWDRTLNELNCYLHPLDTVASSCRGALKALGTAVWERLYGWKSGASDEQDAVQGWQGGSEGVHHLFG